MIRTPSAGDQVECAALYRNYGGRVARFVILVSQSGIVAVACATRG